MEAQPRSSSRILRLALRANATFSTVSGLTFALASTAIAAFLGAIPAAEVMSVGLMLIGFAAFLVWLSLRPSIPAPLVLGVIAADLGWVVGTAFVVFAGVFSNGGAIAAVLVANVVLAFAVAQWIGLRRLPRAASPA